MAIDRGRETSAAKGPPREGKKTIDGVGGGSGGRRAEVKKEVRKMEKVGNQKLEREKKTPTGVGGRARQLKREGAGVCKYFSREWGGCGNGNEIE
ncbi:hypothetical protein ACRE_080370 [Hapsidospora chrysogenum ATCC 11550]|uniref:Uncharacterized protein n=1 Tax=Hapsidospora chrysogenum (strain ATCC 11550 / CBS 779.69 / DSM 880 / IAM 14645 / JCM 23072 / IMI 49137) TaxID=857340 RepID=A0A086SVX7_HAPC1|nr:hypothetical protein ACRE_080370 [Hapsidospora chrysogenum ATCC 11550]